MDNRFKFRAWIPRIKEMLEVDGLFSNGTVETKMLCAGANYGDVYGYYDGEYILMQCTGLTAPSSYRGESEEDRLIYEGDVLQYKHLGDSDSDDVKRGFVVFDVDYYRISSANNYLLSFFPESCKAVKIIGNIHEHPELIAQTE